MTETYIATSNQPSPNDEVEQKLRSLIAPKSIEKVTLPDYEEMKGLLGVNATRVYLKNCLRHAQSELFGMFKKVTNGYNGSSAEGWRAKECDMYEVKASSVCGDAPVMLRKASNFTRGSEVKDLSDLRGCMLIYRDHLYCARKKRLSCGCSGDPLNRGKCWEHPDAKVELYLMHLQDMRAYPDAAAAKHPKRDSLMYSVGTCDSLVKCITFFYRMLVSVQRHDCPEGSSPVLDMIRDPRSVRFVDASVYREATEEGARGEAVVQPPSLVLNDAPDVGLCFEQRSCLDALQAPIELIKGPPGTGKSTLMRSVVRERIPDIQGEELPGVTLIIAVQNKAIDVLVRMFEPFVSPETKILVVGSASNAKMGKDAARFTLQSNLERRPYYSLALQEYKDCSATSGRSTSMRKIKLKKFMDAKDKATTEIFGDVRIVFSTFTELHKLAGTGHSTPLSTHFQARVSSVIIDEGGTVPEYEMAVLSGLSRAQRILCIGDTQQLPPFTNIPRSRAPMGFMERAEKELGDTNVRMLTRQFRMSQHICKLVSDTFYESKLIMSETASLARAPSFAPDSTWLGTGIYWIDYKKAGGRPTHKIDTLALTAEETIQIAVPLRNAQFPTLGQDCFEEKVGNSYANATEVDSIISGLRVFLGQGFFKKGPSSKIVAVICFYRVQTEVLKATMSRTTDLKSLLDSEFLRVQTVDSSQGSEADVVVLSGVRSNASKDVGFLNLSAGRKRACVALSRAKETLIIVGDRATLCSKGLAFRRLWESSGGGGGDEEDVNVHREYNLAVKGSFGEMEQGSGDNSRSDVSVLFSTAAVEVSEEENLDGEFGL